MFSKTFVDSQRFPEDQPHFLVPTEGRLQRFYLPQEDLQELIPGHFL